MVRVSERYGLERTQASLEFVDVDIARDTRIHIDPGAIRLLESPIAHNCASLLQSFFGHVIHLIASRQHEAARALLATLNEPNETRLGLSRGKRARGRAMSHGLAALIWEGLSESKAVQTGLIQDLEDSALFIDRIDKDIISDIVTNIIRRPLVDFTQTMCVKYGIPTVEGVVMLEWDRGAREWVELVAGLPIEDDRPLLLVPKAFCRRTLVYDAQTYYNHFILPAMQEEHFAAGNLVRILRDGTRRPPTKKLLKAQNPDVKQTNIRQSTKNPDALRVFKREAAAKFAVPDHVEYALATYTEEPDWDALLAAVTEVPCGDAGATDYHRAIEVLLTALFFPALDMPTIEQVLNEGRKRVDIFYTNIATRGFFYWLHSVQGIPCGYVPVECKNYTRPIGNPEIDQSAMRLSVQRGLFGVLCYRGYGDKAAVRRRCRDAATAGHGFCIALDDGDLRALVAERQTIPEGTQFKYLFERFKELV
jgi:hypothetical protein